MNRRSFFTKTTVLTSILGIPLSVPLFGKNAIKNDIIKNVRDYGAVGDGKSDDTLPFQKALDQRGIIFIPNGNYSCNLLWMHSNTRLIGESKHKTIIKLRERPKDDEGGVLNISGKIDKYLEDIIVENITFDGNRDELYQGSYSHNIEALEVGYVRDFILRNVHGRNAIADGIDLDACEDFIVEGCSAENCGKLGLHITREQYPDDLQCYRGVVRDCRFWNNGTISEKRGGGMDTIHSENIIVDACIAYNNYRGFAFYPGIAKPNKNVIGKLISYDNYVDDRMDDVIKSY